MNGRVALADFVTDLSMDARMKMHDIRHHMQRYSGSREVKQLLRSRLSEEFLAAIEALDGGGDPGVVRTRLAASRDVFAEFSDHDDSMDEAFERIIAIVFSSRDPEAVRPLPLAELVREEVAYFHRDLRRLPAERLVFSASFDPWVAADPVRVRRLVDNLVMNAAEALDGGDGCVLAEVDLHAVLEERPGVLGPIPPGNYATLTVQDDGCGLDPERAERVFRAGVTTKVDHNGLGLTYVRQTVDDARGFIEVLPAEPRGTKIRIYLPLAQPPAE